MNKDILFYFSKGKKKKLENESSKCVKKIEIDEHGPNKENTVDNFLISPALKQCNDNCPLCNLNLTMLNGWYKVLEEEFKLKYYNNLISFLHNSSFFPPIIDIFRFTFYFPIENTKVVIIGQDPYHNTNQAMGLSFSVPKNLRTPPSLKNIYKELHNDIKGFEIPNHGDLTSWAEQGVLLLNDILTVERNKPASHSKIGWRKFTQKVLEHVNRFCENVVFILWGNYAKEKANLIDKNKHLILKAAHPSPFSAHKFFGCKHFSKTNDYLIKHKKEPINWLLKKL